VPPAEEVVDDFEMRVDSIVDRRRVREQEEREVGLVSQEREDLEGA
jgi:hypothetical protein